MTPEETVRSYWRAWSDHDLDGVLALLAAAFVSRSSLSQGRPADKDMIARGFKMFMKALPDLREQIISVVTEGDIVACQIIETATFTGPMELPTGTVPPTNRAYTLPVASFFRLDAQGLLVEQRTYWDTANWAEQIGVDAKSFAPRS
jgi:steroid delta-isomerase-like uncharacterized protein